MYNDRATSTASSVVCSRMLYAPREAAIAGYFWHVVDFSLRFPIHELMCQQRSGLLTEDIGKGCLKLHQKHRGQARPKGRQGPGGESKCVIPRAKACTAAKSELAATKTLIGAEAMGRAVLTKPVRSGLTSRSRGAGSTKGKGVMT